MSRGVLTAVSGFSGAGKGTIMKELLKRYPGYALSVSATTRAPRPGEREGVEYFFKTEEEFLSMIENGELIEHAVYARKHYGTPKEYVEKMLSEGVDVLLEIEVQGALAVKEKFPETLLIFVSAPSIAEIRNRLVKRGTESPEIIEERISQIEREIREIPKYDYLIINEDLDDSVEHVHHIISAEHHRVHHHTGFVRELEKEIFGGEL